MMCSELGLDFNGVMYKSKGECAEMWRRRSRSNIADIEKEVYMPLYMCICIANTHMHPGIERSRGFVSGFSTKV